MSQLSKGLTSLLSVGDTIKCSNKTEALDIMYALEKEGYYTDFLYEKDGITGIWIEIIKTP